VGSDRDRRVTAFATGRRSVITGALIAPVISNYSAAAPADRRASRPLVFEANRGQADAQVQFVARGAGYTAFLTSTEAVLRLGAHATLHLKPVGADPIAPIVGDEKLPGVVNYFRHGSSTAISAPTYRRVRYVDIYPGIDLVYYGSPRRLEYDFIVEPGADPDWIGLDIEGAERVELDVDGTLVMHTSGGNVSQPAPFPYQQIDGVTRQVAADYVVDAKGRVRFQVGAYDRSQQLVIDPVITLRDVPRRHRRRSGISPRWRSPPRARPCREHLSDRDDAIDGLSDDRRRIRQRRKRRPFRDQAIARRRSPLLDVPRRILRRLRARHRGRRLGECVRHRPDEWRRHLLQYPWRAGREA
jgi:hypothetical protein